MSQPHLNVGGVFPHLASVGDLGPPRSEMAIAAMMPFAGRLWVVNYVSHTRRTGTGCVLMEIDEQLNRIDRPEGRGVDGTYANRIIHHPSNQLMIGPFLIDERRRVRVVESLVDHRLAASMEHLTDPENKLMVLGMEGEFFEVDLATLETRQLFDLCKELSLPQGARPHFKAGFTAHGRVIVANNSYEQAEYRGERAAGRLAEWDGGAWKVLSDASFYEVHGRKRLGATIYATGWDRRSAILMALVGDDKGRSWQRYRLPKGTVNLEHAWQTEWPRIREIEHERYLMDCQGIFYEMSPHAWAGRVQGVKPISNHLWIVPDFCNFRGMLVVGSDQTTPSHGDNVLGAEPESGVWIGKTDDLWRFGKPSGWGGPWLDTPVKAGEPSDPYLVTGFEHKCVQLACDDAKGPANISIELDATGNGRFARCATVEVPDAESVHWVFPTGLSGHWVRFVADRDCTATAYLTYT